MASVGFSYNAIFVAWERRSGSFLDSNQTYTQIPLKPKGLSVPPAWETGPRPRDAGVIQCNGGVTAGCAGATLKYCEGLGPRIGRAGSRCV